MYFRLLIIICFTSTMFAQDKSSRFSVSTHYGMAYNFFVDYDREINKENDIFIPPTDIFGRYELIQKNKVGTIGGVQVSYTFNKRNSLSIGYTRELHVGKFRGEFILDNGTIIDVEDIKLRHLNEFFELNYKRAIGNNNWYLTVGIYVLNPSQAEIDFNPVSNYISIEERNNDNSNLQEGGFSLGTEYLFYTSGNFDLGLNSKIYFTASTGEFETFTFTPILKYNF